MSKAWERYLRLMKARPGAFSPGGGHAIVTDEAVVRAFEEAHGLTIGVVYESPYHLLVVDLLRDEGGRLFPYERLLPAVEAGAVVTVPVCDGRFWLLRQYRHPLRREQFAFPRGFGEVGLSPEENAAKELREELGAQVTATCVLGTVTADSGILGTQATVCLCHIAAPAPQLGHEGIEGAVALTEEELVGWMADGTLTDGFTLAAYSLYAARANRV